MPSCWAEGVVMAGPAQAEYAGNITIPNSKASTPLHIVAGNL